MSEQLVFDFMHTCAYCKYCHFARTIVNGIVYVRCGHLEMFPGLVKENSPACTFFKQREKQCNN